MRRLVLFQHISLDGFAADANDGLDWISYDSSLARLADGIVKTVGSAVYGRKTYEIMGYWRTVLKNPKASKHDLAHARWIEKIEKIVVSSSLGEPDWNNTTVIRDDVAAAFAKLKKKGRGKDLVVFGSPTLGRTLIDLELVDEYRLTLNPVILGAGKRSFGAGALKGLELLEAKKLRSGVLALHYRAKRR
ncbi:MAG TPA: dihydrofolate reductase family protein [Polyangia bacterium]|jgi:dihydrofolate reductase|nr:dihydrofolate reductase family protein [Polyangia bacterium]